MSTETAAPEENTAVSKTGWKKAALHYPLCPSGVRVGIKIPDLAQMIEAGEIPQHLLEAAIGAAARGEDSETTLDDIKKQREFTDLVVKLTVIEPKLTDDDLKDVPYEDKEFIVAVATRVRDLDAEGEHIAGLTKSDRFRRFRKLGEFDSPLASL